MSEQDIVQRFKDGEPVDGIADYLTHDEIEQALRNHIKQGDEALAVLREIEWEEAMCLLGLEYKSRITPDLYTRITKLTGE